MAVNNLFCFVINFPPFQTFVKGVNVAKAEKKAPKKKLKVIKKTTKDLELAGKKKGPPGRSPFVSAPDPD